MQAKKQKQQEKTKHKKARKHANSKNIEDNKKARIKKEAERQAWYAKNRKTTTTARLERRREEQQAEQKQMEADMERTMEVHALNQNPRQYAIEKGWIKPRGFPLGNNATLKE
jgi:hypothetical protein